MVETCEMARYLYHLVLYPTTEAGLRRPFGTGFETYQEYEDYLLSAMQAVMRSIPKAGEGEYLDPETFPAKQLAAQPKSPKRKGKRRGGPRRRKG